MNRFTRFAFLSIAALALVACGNQKTADSNKTAIGVIQYAEHEALDATYDGFLEALESAGYAEKDLAITFENAQGDQSNLQTMVEKLAGKNDLNLAIATPAAQALLNADNETPAVFTAVTDPVAANLVDSLETPGGNMTGSIDATDIPSQIDMLLKVVPNAKTVGIFYNSSEVNSETQAAEAKKALEKAGITVIEKTVTSSNDVQQVMTSLANDVDAIYLPTDNTVTSTITTISDVLKEAKVPAIGSDEAQLEGALFTYGVDYKAIGKQAGQLAVKILKGEKPASLAVEKPQTASVAINEEMAKIVGIDVDTIKSLTK